MTSEGLLVTIRDNVLFESGDAKVREGDRRIAQEISTLLVMDPSRSIVISGHSDNIPIKNEQFDSNWDLSVMRAVNFMEVLLENDELEPNGLVQRDLVNTSLSPLMRQLKDGPKTGELKY